MKDIRLSIRAKNNHLVRFREARGWSQSQMARKIGVAPTYYGQVENLKMYPVTQSGKWNKIARDISSLIGKPEEELFPEVFSKIISNKIEREVGLDEITVQNQPLMLEVQPDVLVHRQEIKARIREKLNLLNAEQQRIIKLRFGLDGPEHTLDQIGVSECLSRQRVHQIEHTALRLLKAQYNREKLIQNKVVL